MEASDCCCCCTLPQTDLVQMDPCRCLVCKDCMIHFLFETRLDPTFRCRSCSHVVASYHAHHHRHHPKRQHQQAEPSASVATTLQECGAVSQNRVQEDKNKKNDTQKVNDNETSKHLQNGTSSNSMTMAKPPPAIERKQSGKRKLAATSDNPNGEPAMQKKRGKNPGFEERVQALMAYKLKHGHCRVPWRYKDDRGLGEWVKNVRRGVKKITKEERKQLNDMGFIWETKKNRLDREWKEKLEKLKAYKRRFGTAHIPWKWEQDISLSEWVHTQRKLNSGGELRADRKAALDAVGLEWVGKGAIVKAEGAGREQLADPLQTYCI